MHDSDITRHNAARSALAAAHRASSIALEAMLLERLSRTPESAAAAKAACDAADDATDDFVTAFRAINASVLVRWEYRLGSTAFLVYIKG